MSTLRTPTAALLFAAFVIGLVPAQPVVAQPEGMARGMETVTAGNWLYDESGTTIGSVRSLSADGHTATLMIGSYYQPGSHEAQVPASALTVVGRKTILQHATMQALNVPSRR